MLNRHNDDDDVDADLCNRTRVHWTTNSCRHVQEVTRLDFFSFHWFIVYNCSLTARLIDDKINTKMNCNKMKYVES